MILNFQKQAKKGCFKVEVRNESIHNEGGGIRISKQGLLDLGGTSKKYSFYLSLPSTDNFQISILIDKRDAGIIHRD